MHHFSPAEMDLARTFSNQAGIALENAQLYQSTVATAERLATLNLVSYEISGTLNPEDTYKAIHAAVEKLMPLDAFVIAMLDEKTNEVVRHLYCRLGRTHHGCPPAFWSGSQRSRDRQRANP